MQRKIISFLLLITLVGCATSPTSLKKSERREQINLTESVSTVSYRGLNVRCEEGALPGIYTAEREDDEGIYFYGSGRSIWNTNAMIQPKPRLSVGGIYVPHNSNQSPRFFYIFETEVHTAESIDKIVQDRIVTGVANPTTTGGAAVGPTVVGNVVGGALVNAMIQSEVGKIVKYPQIEDALIKQKILVARQVLP